MSVVHVIRTYISMHRHVRACLICLCSSPPEASIRPSVGPSVARRARASVAWVPASRAPRALARFVPCVRSVRYDPARRLSVCSSFHSSVTHARPAGTDRRRDGRRHERTSVASVRRQVRLSACVTLHPVPASVRVSVLCVVGRS